MYLSFLCGEKPHISESKIIINFEPESGKDSKTFKVYMVLKEEIVYDEKFKRVFSDVA